MAGRPEGAKAPATGKRKAPPAVCDALPGRPELEITTATPAMQAWCYVDFLRSLIAEIEKINPNNDKLKRSVWLLGLLRQHRGDGAFDLFERRQAQRR